MEKTLKKQEGTSQETQTLWRQLTPMQREQIAVVVLRILRRWRQTQTRPQEENNEPVKMGV
jgi:hypothetical protein